MGTKVAATLDSQKKYDFALSTVAAASFTVADGECALFIGDTFTGGKVEVRNAIINCLERIREARNITPAGTNESYAATSSMMKRDVVVVMDGAAVLPTEAQVGVWYGPLFQPTEGASLTPHVRKLLEHFEEQQQKAA